jgi:GT2 family glycosyltransferase
VFTDDDCLPDPGWLLALQSALESSPDAMIGGRVVNGLTRNMFALASQTILEVVYDHFNPEHGDASFIASNNMAVPADHFREIGGFDAKFRIASEDRELCDRWRWLGRRIVFAPNATIRHAHQLTFASFLWQHFSYGRGAARFHRLCRQRRSRRLGRDLALHGGFLWKVQRPLAPLRARSRVVVAALMVVWQFANAAGFLYEIIASRLPNRQLQSR